MRALILALAGGLAAGCGSLPSTNLFERADVKELVAKRGEPVGLRVAVCGLTPGQAPAEGPVGEAAWQAPLAPDVARDDVADALKRFGAFGAVEILRDLPAGTTPTDAAKAGDRQGMDLVVCVTPSAQTVRYLGHNVGAWVGDILVWTFLWIPHWWVADEEFSMDCAYRLAVHDARSGRELWSKDVSAEARYALNDTQRGLMWQWGFLDVSTVLGFGAMAKPENWRKAAETLGIHARNEASAQMLKEIGTGFLSRVRAGSLEADAGAGAAARTFAVVVGINRYQAPNDYVPQLQFAEADANAIWGWLTQAGGVTKETGTLLVGRDGTREKILAALQAVAARRPRATDTVVLYFSGYGVLEDRPNAKPSDPRDIIYFTQEADIEKPGATGLPFGDIADALGEIEAPVVCLFDAGIGVKVGPRTLGAPREEGAAAGLPSSLSGKANWAVLCASGLAGVASESEADQLGLFTRVCLAGLRGGADADGNGVVTLGELADFATSEVGQLAAVQGVTQEPALLAGARERPVVGGKGAAGGE